MADMVEPPRTPIKRLSDKAVLAMLFAAAGLLLTVILLNSQVNVDEVGCYSLMKSARENTAVFVPSSSQRCDSLRTKATATVPPGSVTLKWSVLTYNRNPKLMVWIMSFSIMVGIAVGLTPILLAKARSIIKTFSISRRVWLQYSVIIVLIGIVISLSSEGSNSGNLLSIYQIIDLFNVPFASSWSIVILTWVTIACGMVPLYGMLMINVAADKINPDAHGAAQQFNILKHTLQDFLSCLALLILFTVLTTAMAQQTLETLIHVDNMVLFPSEFIYAYGLIFTLFLAIVYLPVQYHVQARSKSIPASASADTAGTAGACLEREPILKNLVALISILAPLLGSAFTEVLKNL